MRGSALLPLILALLLPAAANADRLTIAAGPEATLVGLAFGARGELLVRPGPTDSAHHLRIAPGLLVGPEFNYVPVALGYRAIFRKDHVVRPLVGGGFESQVRWVDDAPAAWQLAMYGEGGLVFRLTDSLSLGAAAGLDWTFLGGAGPGLSLRGLLVWSL